VSAFSDNAYILAIPASSRRPGSALAFRSARPASPAPGCAPLWPGQHPL